MPCLAVDAMGGAYSAGCCEGSAASFVARLDPTGSRLLYTVGLPPSLAPTLGQLRVPNVLARPESAMVILTFRYLALFDTIGTLVGVAQQAHDRRCQRLRVARRHAIALAPFHRLG